MAMKKGGSPLKNPFRPGFGGIPPHLAGRGEVQGNLLAGVDAIADGEGAPPNNFAIVGPRGTGKTALLGWLERELEVRGGVSCIRLEGADLGSTGELMRATLGPPTAATIREEISTRRESGAWGGVPKVAGAERRRDEGGRIEREMPAMTPYEWRQRFCSTLAGARGEPGSSLVILADEAHTADLEAIRQLFVAVQIAQNRDLPMLLVIAGTPDLRDRLGAAGTTFWSRLGSHGDVRLGGLRPQDAALAIRNPMQNSRLKCGIDSKALADVLADAQGHPYFLQNWGHLLFDDAAAHPPKNGLIGADSVGRVRPDADKARKSLYADRYAELENAGLIRAGEAFCRAMLASVPPGGEDEVMQLEGGAAKRVVAEALAGASFAGLSVRSRAEAMVPAEKALSQFRHLGLAVQDSDGAWHPGIPSLIRYSAARAGRELAEANRPQPSAPEQNG